MQPACCGYISREACIHACDEFLLWTGGCRERRCTNNSRAGAEPTPQAITPWEMVPFGSLSPVRHDRHAAGQSRPIASSPWTVAQSSGHIPTTTLQNACRRRAHRWLRTGLSRPRPPGQQGELTGNPSEFSARSCGAQLGHSSTFGHTLGASFRSRAVQCLTTSAKCLWVSRSQA